MNKAEVEAALMAGCELKAYSTDVRKAFCKEMRLCNYGDAEMLNAFLWFNAGWNAAKKTAHPDAA